MPKNSNISNTMPRLIIAGGRNFSDYQLVCETLKDWENVDCVVVSGRATGADSLGEKWAIEHRKTIAPFPANWRPNGVYDNAAGYKRNAEMAVFSTHLCAFWDGKSKGTKHMINLAYEHDLVVHVALYGQYTWARFSDGSYEVSTKGDPRFSAFKAIMPDGRSIEEHYQCDVKGYDKGGRNWRLGKGKPPLITMLPEALWEQYLALWRAWTIANPGALPALRSALANQGTKTLSDCFASTPINQAHALAVLLNE